MGRKIITAVKVPLIDQEKLKPLLKIPINQLLRVPIVLTALRALFWEEGKVKLFANFMQDDIFFKEGAWEKWCPTFTPHRRRCFACTIMLCSITKIAWLESHPFFSYTRLFSKQKYFFEFFLMIGHSSNLLVFRTHVVFTIPHLVGDVSAIIINHFVSISQNKISPMVAYLQCPLSDVPSNWWTL